MALSGGEETQESNKDEEVFVAREDILRAVEAYLETGDDAFRKKALGTWGIGKSKLTLELQQRVDDSGQATAIRLVLGAYAPRATVPGRDPSTKTLVQNFDRYCRFLRDLAVAGESREFRQLELSVGTALHAIATHHAINFSPTVTIGDAATFDDDADVGSFTYVSGAEDPMLDALVLDEKSKLTEGFVTTLNAAGRDSGLVLLLDDFDKIREDPVGMWVLELICDITLEDVVVILASAPGSAEIEDSGRLERYDLEVFSAADVEDYFSRRFGFTDPALVQQVLLFSGGLPHAVAMAADVVADRLRRGHQPNLDGVRGEEWASTTVDLLSTIVAEVTDEDLRTVLKAGRLARRLDDQVLRALLLGPQPADGAASGRVDAVRDRLLRYSFVAESNDADLGRSYRFHDYIRQVSPGRPGALQVDAESIHAALAEHYAQRLDAYEDDEAATNTAYGCYYKYEQPGWQKLVLEWTHHAAQLLDPENRERARVYIACIFLEAFWWWGCYVKFPFCESVLDEWDAAQPAGDVAWSNLLRVILASYPPGHLKEDDPGWPLVENALVQIRTRTGIHSKSARLDTVTDGALEPVAAAVLAQRRRLRAMTSLFLAHSYKHRAQYRAHARSFFDDALTWLERCDDQVGVAWTRFEVAELSSALGDVFSAAAREELRAAMRQALDEDAGDYELLGNLHRLDSDLHWAARTIDPAVDGIVRAVLRAYVFQVDPHPPDLYTLTFYQEMLTRLGDRIADVNGLHGEATALAACRRALAGTAPIRLRSGRGEPADDELRAGLAAGGLTLGLLLAPAPPPAEELQTAGSSFVTDACMAVGLISDRLDEEDAALAAA